MINYLTNIQHKVFKQKIVCNIAFFGLLFSIICTHSFFFQQQQEEREITIRGSIVDEEGRRVSNVPVRFIMQRRGFNKTNSAIDILEEKEISTRSDSKGLFEIIWLEDTSFNNFYIRFYREGEFDDVQYQIPKDVDITQKIKLSDTIKVDHILAFNPEWGRIKEEIEQLGLESDEGKILRLRGIPDKKEKFRGKRFKDMEIWWYYSKGLCYRFKSSKLDKIFRFNTADVKKTNQTKEK
jgi:hypothetical protein